LLLLPASSDAGIFLAIGKQTLASKEASYNFAAAKHAKNTGLRTMPRELGSFLNIA